MSFLTGVWLIVVTVLVFVVLRQLTSRLRARVPAQVDPVEALITSYREKLMASRAQQDAQMEAVALKKAGRQTEVRVPDTVTDSGPVVLLRSFFNWHEQTLFVMLSGMLDDSAYLIFPKIHLSKIFPAGNASAPRQGPSSLNVDFLIVTRGTFRPVLGVQIVGVATDVPVESAREREQLFVNAHLPLITLDGSGVFTSKQLRAELAAVLPLMPVILAPGVTRRNPALSAAELDVFRDQD